MANRLEQLRKMLTDEPDDPFLLYSIAQEHARADEHELAIEHYDRVLAADPDYLYAYYHKAGSLEELERIDEARAALDEGLRRARAAGDAKAAGELHSALDLLE